MTLTGADIRVLQVHPNRRCNLRCLHCYSSSGPDQREELDLPLLLRVIRDSAALGYNVLSVSGGEPLLYTGLRDLCHEAHAGGMLATLVTNGIPLTRAKLAALKEAVDAIAISLDGAPPRHNRIRGVPGAFESMKTRLPLLRESGIRFGFIFTVTGENLPELEWAADFAIEQGAAFLQVHPLEAAGRALTEMPEESLADEQTAVVWVIVGCLRKIHGRKLSIHFDALHRDRLPVQPNALLKWKSELDAGTRCLGEIVSPLVVESDGTVTPLRYGLPRSFSFGNLKQSSLAEMAGVWIRDRSVPYFDLHRTVLDQILRSERKFVNFYEMMSTEACSKAGLVGIVAAV
jgi:Fe-coproporphyrin III synthase